MSHELTQHHDVGSRISGPRNRGAFVSKIRLASTAACFSADRAYDTVYLEDTLVGPAADETNTTPGFGRFCSGSLAGWAEGFDRPIYFANEESGAPTVVSLGERWSAQPGLAR
ncbi:MAG: hypothetical protein IPK67_20585 [Planctomycetes bacterium]|nr:hypothetical protein [Planctomycetota bacterium]